MEAAPITPPATRTDVPAWLWLTIPLSYYFLRYLAFYAGHLGWIPVSERFFQGETGFIESVSVICLLTGFCYSCALLIKQFPRLSPVMRGLFICYALGCFFMLGEEASWGQHYFRWETPDSFNNVQNETNFHNSELAMSTFNRLRIIVGHLVVLFGAIIPSIFLLRKKTPKPEQHRWWWFWPSYICIPTALLVALSTLPNDLNQFAGTQLPKPNGLGEFKESYIGMFLMLFIISVYYRMKWMHENEQTWRR